MGNKRIKYLTSIAIAAVIFIMPAQVLAHAIVTPEQIKVDQTTTFLLTIESETETPTAKVRLVLPEGLEDVKLYAKTGWKVEAVNDNEKGIVKEIIWSGGKIPVNLKDFFTFEATAPSSEATLYWKVYQTYENGGVSEWTRGDKNASDEGNPGTGPASATKVLAGQADASVKQSGSTDNTRANLALILAAVALITSLTVAAKVRK